MATVGGGFGSRTTFLASVTLIALWSFFVGCKDSTPPSTEGKKVEAAADTATVEAPVGVAAVDHFARLRPTFPEELQKMFDDSGEVTPEYKDRLLTRVLLLYTRAPSEEIVSFAARSRGNLYARGPELSGKATIRNAADEGELTSVYLSYLALRLSPTLPTAAGRRAIP